MDAATEVSRFREDPAALRLSSHLASPEESGWRTIARLVLVHRLGLLGLLFSIELVAITLFLDNAELSARGGLAGLIRSSGSQVLRGIVIFTVIFLTFALLGFSSRLISISRSMSVIPISRAMLASHIGAFGFFVAASVFLYARKPPAQPDLVALLWLISGLAAIGLGAAAFIRPEFWVRIVQSTGYLWAASLVAAAAAWFSGSAMRLLWPLATRVTFSMVEALLRPFGIFTGDPATMSIGSQRFTVWIAPECSGLEGIALILVFTGIWLVLFRRECRFPHALILLPAGIAILFLLNSARIAALILIGNAGFESIALGGFHSQAGWIAFNFVALGICVAAREVSWISTRRPNPQQAAISNPTLPWLVPFIAILAAGIASRAMTGSFEWLYPLRFVAAATALWIFRRQYRALDWSVDWTAPAAGLLVFVIWVVLARSAPGHPPQQLAAAPWALRSGWLVFRVTSAVITVPIAEELAFRGFVLRRFISAEWDSVSFRQRSWLALLGSSLLFGLLHGSLWIAGSVAGLVFALVVNRRGRLGNAVVAHATTNALLAVDVLVFHHWNLW